MNAILLIFLTIFDCIFWGYFWEYKKSKLLFVFWELNYKGKPVYPVYRTIQGLLDILAIGLIYHYGGLIPAIGFGLAWYFMVKEFMYYAFMWQWQLVLNFENHNLDTYWLKRWYFSGKWLFKNGFKFKRFVISFIIGLIFLITSNLIQ